MNKRLIGLLLLLALPLGAAADEDDSYAKLFVIHSRLAAQGSSEAQFKLGEMYEEGRGTVKDLNKARDWYTKAAEQGHDEAKKRLFTLGNRVSTDDVKRLEREAEQARKRAEEERQAAQAQQRIEDERNRQIQARQRAEDERERQAQQRAEDERSRQQQAKQRAEEERARQAAQQKRLEEERTQRAATQQPAATTTPAPAKNAPSGKEGDSSFETDPCKGAAARFLSTCK